MCGPVGLGIPGQHGIAAGKRSGDLADKGGEVRIANAQTGDEAAWLEREFVPFAGRTRQGLRSRQRRAQLRRAEAKISGRFAGRVVPALAPLANQFARRFEGRRRPLEAVRAQFPGHQRPTSRPCLCGA